MIQFNFDAQDYPYASKRHVVYAKNGMACAGNPTAASIGLQTLMKGGNAVDAAGDGTEHLLRFHRRRRKLAEGWKSSAAGVEHSRGAGETLAAKRRKSRCALSGRPCGAACRGLRRL